MSEGKYQVERDGRVMHEIWFDSEEEWVSWMHRKARRAGVAGMIPDVGIDPQGKRWVQLGFILVEEAAFQVSADDPEWNVLRWSGRDDSRCRD